MAELQLCFADRRCRDFSGLKVEAFGKDLSDDMGLAQMIDQNWTNWIFRKNVQTSFKDKIGVSIGSHAGPN